MPIDGIVAPRPGQNGLTHRAPRGTLWTLLAGVLLAPLPLGAVPQWSWAALALLAGLLLGAIGWRSLTGTPPAVAIRRVRLPLVCFAAVLAWSLVQALPITPEAWHHPLWQLAGTALGREVAGSISLNPADTLNGAVRLATSGAIFFVALVVGRDPAAASTVIRASALACGAYAAYAVTAFLSGTETILWFAKTSYQGDLTGTFVNRNSYATFAGLGLLCASATLAHDLEREAGEVSSVRERTRLALTYVTGAGAPYLCAGFLMVVALLFSHSRAGLVSAWAGLFVFCLAIAGGAARRFAGGPRLAVLALLAGLVLLAWSGATTLSRLVRAGDDAPLRLRIFEQTLLAIQDRPLLGSGLGTFREAFRPYRTPDMLDPVHQAHNSYLELAMELGIPAACLILLALAALQYRLLLGLLRRRRRRVFPALGIAATTLAGLHSLVDFGLQNSAIAALYAVLLGTACAQSWSSREDLSA